MHSVSPRPARDRIVRLASAASLTIILMLAAALARAQCSVSGPSALCGGGTVTLCAPDGESAYEWSDANGGFLTSDQCLNVSAAGSYSVIYYDAINGLWFGPCEKVVTAGTSVAASISGPTSACIGATIDLCGPTGNLSYAWTGPNGFTDIGSCIHVTVSGTYQLVVTDLAGGCSSAPATQTIAFTTCSAPSANCPRPAWWWRRECSDPHDGGMLSANQMASVAACLDQHCDLFAWPSPADGFCSTLSLVSHSTIRAHAKRQFAAVVANLCAGGIAITGSNGVAVGLDAATVVGTTTVGAWASDTDHRMMTLESGSLNDQSIRAAYRDIIRTAWLINHGHGIGPVCGRPNHDLHQGASGASTTIGAGNGVLGNESVGADVNSDDAAEPLEAELSDEGKTEMVIHHVSPNPTTSRASISYELMASSNQPVSIGIYDIAGRRLIQLVNAPQAPGVHVIDWDGRDSSGQRVSGGVYFVRGHAGATPVQSSLTVVR